MTSLSKPSAQRGIGPIVEQLHAVGLRRWRTRMVTALLILVAALAAGLLLAVVACGYWKDQPPAMLRYSMLAALLAGWAAVLVAVCGPAMFWRPGVAQTARFVEQALPHVRNDLINSVLLAGDQQQVSAELVAGAIDEAGRNVGPLALDRSISARPMRNWAIVAGALALAVGAMGVSQTGPTARGLLAVFQPGGYVPAVNSLTLLELEPGDTSRFVGQGVTITARVANEGQSRLVGRLIIDGRGELPMVASDDCSTFSTTISRLDGDLRYAVKIGQDRWPTDRPWFTVSVLDRVEITGLGVHYDYPTYTGIEDATIASAAGPLEAPMGTAATLSVSLASPAPAATLEMLDGRAAAMTPSAGRDQFRATVPIERDGAYRIVIRDQAGRTLGQLPELSPPRQGAAVGDAAQASGYFPIRAQPDRPPSVEITSPARDVTLGLGESLKIVVRASDDHGLSRLELTGQTGQDDQGAARIAFQSAWPAPLGKDRTVEHAFTVPADAPDDGSLVITYAALASDSRDLGSLSAQTTRSGQFKITVQNAAKLAAERQKRYDELRRRLMELLTLQEKQRLATSLCAHQHQTLAAVTTEAAGIAAAQGQLRSSLVDLVENFPFEPEMATIRQACALLGANEASAAVEQAGVLAALTDLSVRQDQCDTLGATQQSIIETLQTLLAVMPSLAGNSQPTTQTAGGDLTPETREKLAQLKADLEKYIDAQKKLIAASEQLAKKPVDNFTAEDEKLLNELRQGQQDWEKFINERLADFSKLAQQDFSNPVMLKELISVKTDVTMAADALSKKAIEIATALEDNGIENAKTLTANIEKWLPDEPDRIKWSMEDPAGSQENVEQAQLPTELEDLVGDLLEEEEDLFEEMDDLSSKYTMSGDKGIGWGAADGPISNMNAQGVTGNQLPNTSEMQGRSGEGRSGKSSGEFVEDKAVGKGGRRTPTRLTEEPFSKGEVNDVSQEQAGGATGGGKISGSGQEGLEGPVPPDLAKEIKRLAGKQATLVNRAERVRAAMKSDDYSSFRMLQAITLMNRVQADLEANRYQNVLRQRQQTVEALSQTRLLLSGGIDVQADSSAAMPKYVRDDISDAMNSNLPPRYREILQKYYQRMGQQR